MAILNVNYDLRTPGKGYVDLIAKLQAYPAWCHALNSCWFIETELAPDQLFAQLQPYLDSNDGLIVTPVTPEHGWWCQGLNGDVIEWLHKRLDRKM